MGYGNGNFCCFKKKLKNSNRQLTTPLFILRAIELGISISDLELLDIGVVMDMFAEKINDTCGDDEAANEATQADFDNF